MTPSFSSRNLFTAHTCSVGVVVAGANARASAAWRPALRWLVDSPHWPSLRHMAQLRLFGRALFSPLLRLGRSYDEVAKKWPQATALVTTTLKTSAADAFAQLVVEQRNELDLKRHAMFCMFGFAYLGYWQYYLYNVLFARWCKHITKVVGHFGSAPVKTFLDQAIHHPFMYFPSFYLLKGSMQQRSPAESLRLCYDETWENCKALWAVWVPAQLVNFSVVPMHLRIPFVAAVSFLWTIIISNLRGQMDEPSKAAAPTVDHSAQPVDAAAAAAAVAAATSQTMPTLARQPPS